MRRVFVDKKFSILRKRVKHSQKKVMDCIIADHNADICVLCGSSDDITREHIIPQWAFESNAEKSLINKRIISQLITLKPLYQHAECAILICWECLSIT